MTTPTPTKIRFPLLGIDPGVRSFGWAYFGTAGFLIACGVSRSSEEQTAYAAREHMRRLYAALVGMPAVATLVVEQMRVYPGPQQKGDQNDLIAVTHVGGGVHVLPDVLPDADLPLVPPREWKGQVPKDIMEGRIRRSLTELEARLADTSLLSVPAGVRHNGWDAIGLSLAQMGRLR